MSGISKIADDYNHGRVSAEYAEEAKRELNRATAAYKKMGELRDKIEKSSKDMDQKMAMVAGLTISSSQVKKMAELVKKAMEPIESMKGTWIALGDDLKALRTTVAEDITQLPMVVKSMGVYKALEQWENVAKAANVIQFSVLKKA